MKRSHWGLVVLIAYLFPGISHACLWDYDTLKQERARFPSTLELITGKFLRHSPEFYEWRIQDRLKKLEADPNNVALYDDLAVAYEKTGQVAKGIEILEAKEKIKPGLYETYSNLGTLYILSGDLEAGLPYIDKALANNPNAHFGREKYQKWLVEYAISRMHDGKLMVPLQDVATDAHGPDTKNFKTYLFEKLAIEYPQQADFQQAVTAVLGMMRFANHDNPLLLEALGDLLADWRLRDFDAKRLAARAYLQASYVVKDDDVRQAYRKLAERVLEMQTFHPGTEDELPLSQVEADFREELADANAWYAQLKVKEVLWIQSNANPEAEFDKLYENQDEIQVNSPHRSYPMHRIKKLAIGIMMVFGTIVFLIILWIGKRLRRAFNK